MKRRIVLLLLGILALIGVSFLMTSPVLGLRAADSWLRSVGDSDTQTYLAMMNGYVAAYRTLGAILTALGFVGGYLQVTRNPWDVTRNS